MRNRHYLLLDLALLAFLPFALFALRLETAAWPEDYTQALLAYIALALPIRLGVAYGSGLYKFLWRYASLVEMERLLFAGAVSGVLTIIAGGVLIKGLGLASIRLPYSFLLGDAVLAFGIMAAPRIASRLLARHKSSKRSGLAKRALIVGAGEVGQSVLREIRRGALHIEPIGFVDDDPTKAGQMLGGVPVVGRVSDLAHLVAEHDADEVIIAIAGVRGTTVRAVVQALASSKVETRIVPGYADLVSGTVSVQALRKVEIQDLLRREPIVTDLTAIGTLAFDETVLITGAGGSIGSELCRQIASLNPARLVLLDHSENQMFDTSGELKRAYPKLPITSVIADIRDAARLRSIVSSVKPFAIFHAAAHKHVPLMEENIVEAVTNNVLGTRNLLDAALDADVAHLVNISTDKAVRPTSVMGATKRIAELLVLNAAEAEGRNFSSVRFGNVLGSRGSVIPTFLRQIEEGGPVTVTHPEMRRYFMTIPEAVQLVLQAGALGTGGELFVLDMGEPVRIVDLARDLIRLSGLEEGIDINVEFTGVRPGEKMYEEVLFGGEDVRPTDHPKVLRAASDPINAALADQVEQLVQLAAGTGNGTDREIRHAIRAIVPEFALHDARTDPNGQPMDVPPRISGPKTAAS
ncbi:MAG: nucleoside-diphosphate sugar epimerase/dehydratase [Gemmatimonadetes bacterium]|nr:nucleoside-diphosphate sugar epimerase/dehydratase [Gemmatimonadota bacterium]